MSPASPQPSASATPATAPVLSPGVPLPAGLATLRVTVSERFLNGQGETTRLLVTGLDAQGQPLAAPLPLSFSQSRPDDFSISPDGVVTALKDFGFSEVVIRVVGTDLEARTTLSVSLPSTYSGGGNSTPAASASVDTSLRITGFSQNSVLAGTQVTIRGRFFGTRVEDLTVLFAGTPVQIISASDNAITVVVPRISGTPEITVQRQSQTATSTGLTVRKIIHVDDDANAANNGSSWVDAYQHLQDALADAVSGDQIWIADGSYSPADADGDRAATFQLVAGVSVYGGFAGTETALDQRLASGNEAILTGDLNGDDGAIAAPFEPSDATRDDNSYHVLVGASNVTLERLIVEGGNASASSDTNLDNTSPLFLRYTRGGGLWARGFTNMVLNHVTFRGNSASVTGGGVYAANSLIDFNQCTFEYNRSMALGGGLALIGGSNVTRALNLDSVVFTANRSGNLAQYSNAGGGLYLSANAVIENALFEDNTSIYAGGALVFGTDSVTFRDTQFINNQAINGGGLIVESSNATLEDLVFSQNQALEPEGNDGESNRGVGGGMFILPTTGSRGSQVNANRIIFDRNTATSYGGAIFLNYESGLSSGLDITNGVFSGNQVLAIASESNNYRGQGGAIELHTTGTLPLRVRYSTFVNNTAPEGFAVSAYDANIGDSTNPLSLAGSIFHNSSVEVNLNEVDTSASALNVDADTFVDLNAPFGTGSAFFDFFQAGLRLSLTADSGLRLQPGQTPVPATDVTGRTRNSANTDWGAYQSEPLPQ